MPTFIDENYPGIGTKKQAFDNSRNISHLQMIVYSLSDSIHKIEDNELLNVTKNFMSLFDNGFTLKYSTSFNVVSKVVSTQDGLDILDENLNNLYIYAEKYKNDETQRYNLLEHQRYDYKHLGPSDTTEKDLEKLQININLLEKTLKLLDYLILETNRLKITLRQSKDIQEETEKIDALEENYEKQMEENARQGNNAITMFTIFSAVIITFSGGISIATNTFAGLSGISPYKIVFMMSLLGFVLFNTVFMLLYVVSKMVNKSIGAQCPYLVTEIEFNSRKQICGNGICDRNITPNLFCKIKKKYFYNFVINIILLILMYYSFICWIFSSNNRDLLLFIKNNLVLQVIAFLLPPICVAVTVVINICYHRNQAKQSANNLKDFIAIHIIQSIMGDYTWYQEAFEYPVSHVKTNTLNLMQTINYDDLCSSKECLNEINRYVDLHKDYLYLYSFESVPSKEILKYERKRVEKQFEIYYSRTHAEDKLRNNLD